MAYNQKLQQVYFQCSKLRRNSSLSDINKLHERCDLFKNLTACNRQKYCCKMFEKKCVCLRLFEYNLFSLVQNTDKAQRKLSR